jgi:hypothetical protein
MWKIWNFSHSRAGFLDFTSFLLANLMIYATDSLSSQSKLVKFFGEKDLVVISTGSMAKLERHYGLSGNRKGQDPSSSQQTLLNSWNLFRGNKKLASDTSSINSIITVPDIHGGGFNTSLKQSPLFICFMMFCIQEYSVENFLFVFEIDQLKSAITLDKAKDIYQNYFAEQGELQLNVTFRAKKHTKDSIIAGNPNCFELAYKEILPLVEQSFKRFLNSEIFQKMMLEVVSSSSSRTQKILTTRLQDILKKTYKNKKMPLLTQKCEIVLEKCMYNNSESK